MTTASKWRIGPLTKAPADFKPTETATDQNYLYQLDFTNQILRRSPLHWDSPQPSGFYRLLTPAPELAVEPPATRPRPARRLLPAFMRIAFSTVMLAGLVMLVYPLYRGLRYTLENRLAVFDSRLIEAAEVPAMPTQWGKNQVIIPKIGVRAAILESQSQDILDKQEGVWHQKGDLKTNFVLAGHRFKYLPPNTSTFYNLGQLQSGDVVLLDWYNRRYAYTVQKNFTVSQDQKDVLQDQPAPVLTLYTCNDKNQTERVVIVAVPQD